MTSTTSAWEAPVTMKMPCRLSLGFRTDHDDEGGSFSFAWLAARPS
jgi:hypothetical protein